MTETSCPWCGFPKAKDADVCASCHYQEVQALKQSAFAQIAMQAGIERDDCNQEPQT